MFNHENLKGRVAVVTGGGGVLCGGFAKTLAAQGCKVAVLDLNEAAGRRDQRQRRTGDCRGLQCVGAGVYARRAGCDCRETGHL